MKLLKMSFLDFMSKYFAILDTAFNCLAAFLQHLLICSVKVSRLSMITRWVTSCWFGDNIINWNFFGFAFMPLSPNHCMAVLQSSCKLSRTVEDWKRQTTTNYHQHNCTNCNCWWNGTNHSWKCWTRPVLIWNLVGHLYVSRPKSYDSCLS